MSNEQHGVWIVADHYWHTEGPGYAIPFDTEIDALRHVNCSGGVPLRAWFVPFGKDLREVMNG